MLVLLHTHTHAAIPHMNTDSCDLLHMSQFFLNNEYLCPESIHLFHHMINMNSHYEVLICNDPPL